MDTSATPVRTALRPRFVATAVVLMVVLTAIPQVVLATLPPLFAGPLVSVPIWALTLLAFGRMAIALWGCQRWIELDGSVIRTRRLVSGRVVEHTLAELSAVEAGNALPLPDPKGELIVTTPNRGYVLRFRDGTAVSIWRGRNDRGRPVPDRAGRSHRAGTVPQIWCGLIL